MGTAGGTSPATITVIEEEGRRILRRALDEATAMLSARRAELDRLIAALLERESLERNELAEILAPC
jgi:cell division protease FtsH